MLDIFIEKQEELVIFKPLLIDTALSILIDSDKNKTQTAKNAMNEMFEKMYCHFQKKQIVRMYFNKNTDSKSIVFLNFNLVKIWLVFTRINKTSRLILQRLKAFCEKKNIPLPDINIVFGDFDINTVFNIQTKELSIPKVYNTEMYFKNSFHEAWFNSEIIRKAVKAVDKSEVINGRAIQSPVFGIMPPEKLSGGVKTLILIYNNPETVFNASTCGDNCVKWIEKIAKGTGIVIGLYHTMRFTEKGFSAYIVNASEVVDSYEKYILYADKYCRDQV